jgi:hypothetical protein
MITGKNLLPLHLYLRMSVHRFVALKTSSSLRGIV